jgi:hypothetical protein
MKRNWFKLGLDIMMAVGIFSMFSVAAVGLAFHEIVGLSLFGAFVLHMVLNRRWIISFTRRLFSKNVPFRVRLSYILSLLLLISFIIIILSGITMSKFVFAGVFEEVETFKSAHYFFSSLALVLVGIHAGLHWSFIKAMFKKAVKLPEISIKPLAAAALLLIVFGGAWSLTSSSFVSWIASPVLGLPEKESGWPEGFEGRGQGRNQKTESSLDDSIDHDETEVGSGGYRGGLGASFDALKTLEVVAQYGSIMILIATLTAGTEILIKKRKKKTIPQPEIV